MYIENETKSAKCTLFMKILIVLNLLPIPFTLYLMFDDLEYKGEMLDGVVAVFAATFIVLFVCAIAISFVSLIQKKRFFQLIYGWIATLITLIWFLPTLWFIVNLGN